ncbi:MAG TPA: hypothetical protein VFJ90_12950 [Candidatus Didemnitutus sp.]|nr:hypothetical protein [Candidatus Didemnitutus sp.]
MEKMTIATSTPKRRSHRLRHGGPRGRGPASRAGAHRRARLLALLADMPPLADVL